MARILGVDIPNNKRVVISLTYIYGIGKSLSTKISNECKIDLNKRVSDLSDDELSLYQRLFVLYLLLNLNKIFVMTLLILLH